MARNANSEEWNSVGAGTQTHDILRTVRELDDDVTSGEVSEEVDVAQKTVSATFTKLHNRGFVERVGRGGRHDPYRYYVSEKGRELLDALDRRETVGAADEEDKQEKNGLSALFSSVEEGDAGTESFADSDSDEDPDEDPDADLDGLENRVGDLERRLCATGDGGGEATLCLPVADRDADLDHATVLYELGSRRKVRRYLRALMGLPQDEESADMTERRPA